MGLYTSFCHVRSTWFSNLSSYIEVFWVWILNYVSCYEIDVTTPVCPLAVYSCWFFWNTVCPGGAGILALWNLVGRPWRSIIHRTRCSLFVFFLALRVDYFLEQTLFCVFQCWFVWFGCLSLMYVVCLHGCMWWSAGEQAQVCTHLCCIWGHILLCLQ